LFITTCIEKQCTRPLGKIYEIFAIRIIFKKMPTGTITILPSPFLALNAFCYNRKRTN